MRDGLIILRRSREYYVLDLAGKKSANRVMDADGISRLFLFSLRRL